MTQPTKERRNTNITVRTTKEIKAIAQILAVQRKISLSQLVETILLKRFEEREENQLALQVTAEDMPQGDEPHSICLCVDPAYSSPTGRICLNCGNFHRRPQPKND